MRGRGLKEEREIEKKEQRETGGDNEKRMGRGEGERGLGQKKKWDGRRWEGRKGGMKEVEGGRGGK